MDSTALMNYLIMHPYLIALVIVWSLAWKGIALWIAARKNSLAWFVAVLILNTLGILEIVYIFAISKIQSASTQTENVRPQGDDEGKKVVDIKK